MSKELYKVHRPKLLKQLVGQPEAVKVVKAWTDTDKIPHAILITGPSGCGKTTIGRILKDKLACVDADFTEINVANCNGVDDIRAIARHMGLAPIGGKARVWLLDECHQLTSAAQNALLKMLEDAPKTTYFILATTDPAKLLPTVISRCSQVKVKPLNLKDSMELMRGILAKEKKTVGDDVLEKIFDVAEGAPRRMLVLLDTVLDIATDEERMEAIEKGDIRQAGIALAKALFKYGTSWSDVAAILKTLQDEPETARRIVLGYANACLLGQKSKTPFADRAFFIIDAFSKNFFDTGRAGLTAACYEVCTTK